MNDHTDTPKGALTVAEATEGLEAARQDRAAAAKNTATAIAAEKEAVEAERAAYQAFNADEAAEGEGGAMTALWLAIIGVCFAGAVCLLRRPRRVVYEEPMPWTDEFYRRVPKTTGTPTTISNSIPFNTTSSSDINYEPRARTDFNEENDE